MTAAVVDIELGTAVNDQPIEDGFYPAALVSLDVVDNRFEEGRKQVRFTWEVQSGAAKGRTLTSWANLGTLTPKSKLRQITEALLGRQLEPGETPRSSNLLGREARLTVETTHKLDGDLISKVTNVKPLKRAPGPVDSDEMAL